MNRYVIITDRHTREVGEWLPDTPYKVLTGEELTALGISFKPGDVYVMSINKHSVYDAKLGIYQDTKPARLGAHEYKFV